MAARHRTLGGDENSHETSLPADSRSALRNALNHGRASPRRDGLLPPTELPWTRTRSTKGDSGIRQALSSGRRRESMDYTHQSGARVKQYHWDGVAEAAGSWLRGVARRRPSSRLEHNRKGCCRSRRVACGQGRTEARKGGAAKTAGLFPRPTFSSRSFPRTSTAAGRPSRSRRIVAGMV